MSSKERSKSQACSIVKPCKVMLKRLAVDMCSDLAMTVVNARRESIDQIHKKYRNRSASDFDEMDDSNKSQSESSEGSDSSYRPSKSSLGKKKKLKLPVKKKKLELPVKKKKLELPVKKKKLELPVDEKSDYEKMMQQNKDKRLAFLKSLEIDEAKENFCKAVHDMKEKRKTNKKKVPSSPLPLRTKLCRLAKTDAVGAIEEPKVKEPKVLPETFKFEEVLKGNNIFVKFAQDFSELDYEKTEASHEFMSRMKNMQLCESQISKVLPKGTAAMDIHPVRDKIVVCAGSDRGHVSFWNMSCDSNPYVFVPHLANVSNLKFNPYDSNQIVSSSYDGTFRCGDMKKHVFEEVYRASDGTRCSYFDVLSKSTFIVALKTGNVAIVDYRDRRKSVKNHSCHGFSVKSVCIHPVKNNYFISSEERNGTIRLWDLRNLRKTPVADIKNDSPGSSFAFFSPVTGNSILASRTKSICIFDSSSLRSNIPLKKSIAHNNSRKGRLLKAIWAPNTDDIFVVARSGNPAQIKVFNHYGRNIHNFMGEYLSSLTRHHAFHPTLPVLAGGTDTGRVFVFTNTQ